MLTLPERESKRLLERNKPNELEKHEAILRRKWELWKTWIIKCKRLWTRKPSAIDVYKELAEEKISKFDAVISTLERVIQLLADNNEAKFKHREDQEQELEFRRELKQEKELEEMRMEMSQKSLKYLDLQG